LLPALADAPAAPAVVAPAVPLAEPATELAPATGAAPAVLAAPA
jgi:hypothetical protein